jgi:uncharacterized repeat protein (TIGR03803 family)
MPSIGNRHNCIWETAPRATAIVLSWAIVLAMAVVATQVQAQTFSVIHTFTGGADGSEPSAGGLASDAAGNLYGTAGFGGLYTSSCNWGGGNTGCGTVYKMTRKGSGWIFSVLYSFNGATDGYSPDQIVSFGPDGSLYGSTYWGPGFGCDGNGCGTVFKLQPPATACRAVSCPWNETVLHQFQGYPNDGSQPAFGHLVFDSVGNLYSTTAWGGPAGVAGNVYELAPAGNSWTEYVLHNFTGGYDGDASWSGVVFDNSGNLYGTTTFGGASSSGVIFQLTPSALSWTEKVLHSFQLSTDGAGSSGAVVIDASGNLYGANDLYGPNNGGTVWELSPANGGWTFTVLYAFTGTNGGPSGGLLMDKAGNLYGATYADGAHGYGNVFKLRPANGGWSYTSLYDFTGGSDGAWPNSKLTIDANGNLFGTTELGGSGQGYNGNGVVFEITP